MLTLRPYQSQAIDAVFDYWADGGGNALLDIATGLGKSVIIAEFCRKLLTDWPTMRLLMLAPSRELVGQNAVELMRLWPQAPIGINSASLGRRDTRSQILFAMVNSIYRNPGLIGTRDLIIADEAHLMPKSGDGMYRTLLAGLRESTPDMRILGLSATCYRLDSGLLHKGDDALFDDVVYSYGIKEGVADGYLSPLISRPTSAQIDTSSVHIRGGEYIASELEDASMLNVREAVSELVEKGKDRRAWLAFCAGVKHANAVCDAIKSHGVSCAVVTGETPSGERDAIIRAYKAGNIRCLTNVNVLTTGFNVPHVDMLAMLRATLSTGLYCLDSETEILTSHGWKGIGHISVGDCAPAMDLATGKGRWSRVLGAMRRPMRPDEKWVTYDAPRANFRVTDGHRMIYATQQRASKTTKKWSEWKVDTAGQMASVKCGVKMPTAIQIEQPGVPLTDAELYFIGMVMTDGTISSHQVSISQSERHPEIVERIERCLIEAKLLFKKRPVDGSRVGKEGTVAKTGVHIVERHKRWHWTVSIGKPKKAGGAFNWKENSNEGTGCNHLMPWLDKDFATPLLAMRRSQFITLITALHDGDGFKVEKSPSCDWTPRSWSICSVRETFVERIQMLCAIHGMTCHVCWMHKDRKRPIARVTISPQDWRSVGGSTVERNRPQIEVHPATSEEVWCIETDAGTIITRRRGKVTVMGNCQMAGRGTRLAEGKSDCLVLDFAGNVSRHGPVDAISISDRQKSAKVRPEEVRAKVCPECEALIALQARTCPHCSYVYPVPEKPKHEARADAQAIIMASVVPSAWRRVSRLDLSLHSKPDKPPSLRATYRCGLDFYSEWIALESLKARPIAERWWRKMGGAFPVPQSVMGALERKGEIQCPHEILVRPEGKYWRVVAHRFSAMEAA